MDAALALLWEKADNVQIFATIAKTEQQQKLQEFKDQYNVGNGLKAEMKANAKTEQLINIDVKISNSRGTAFL